MMEAVKSDKDGKPASGTHTQRPRVLLTIGDINGIGPEVILKCLTDVRLNKYMEPTVIGSVSALEVHANKLGFDDMKFASVEHCSESIPEGHIGVLDVRPGERPDISFGKISADAGLLAMKAVEKAADLCLDGQADAMVTAPISKETIARAGYEVPGHSEFVAQRAGCDTHTMMMVSNLLRVGLVTAHLPVWDVPKNVTKDAILTKTRNITASLQVDFGIERPKIAVLGLNPHAGDGGVLGREEIESIIPAVKQSCDEGLLVFGPFPADGFFAVGGYRNCDIVLAMYHDQGLVPFKVLSFESGVNYTAGLPIVRTSPDHGSAFAIAGEGKASPGSMRQALYLAIDIARRRARRDDSPGVFESQYNA